MPSRRLTAAFAVALTLGAMGSCSENSTDFRGIFVGGDIRLELRLVEPGSYRGVLHRDGKVQTVRAVIVKETLNGESFLDDIRYGFTAKLSGEQLRFESGSTRLILRRTAAPAPVPVAPAGK